ncbi:MAG: hypothetical protein R2824_35895 [Saprospiraceae bacterium]|nr:hypothetical protein [Lewinella sp.]
MKLFKFHLITSLIFTALLAYSCQKSPGAKPGPGGVPSEQSIRKTVDQRFPFTPNQPFSATYICGRRNSNLIWHFRFGTNQNMQVLFTTDTYDDYAFNGSYTYQNDQLRLMMPGGPTMPFPQGLDEVSRVIMPQFGLIGGFSTDNMICICEGHDMNVQAPPVQIAHYDCPEINIQAATYEDNAVEFVLQSLPFNQTVNGSIFRHQDTYISGKTNPNIRRGYGIYRQDGDQFWATFSLFKDFVDFAGNQLPFAIQTSLPFDDFNLLSGRFGANDREVSIDQLSPETGPCRLE